VKIAIAGALSRAQLPAAGLAAASSEGTGAKRSVTVALIQFDAVPEQTERNLAQMEDLARRAKDLGAYWVMFHEGTLCDYTPRLAAFAEPVPDGASTRRIAALASRLQCYISFGLSELDRGRFYMSQVFVGPRGFCYRYRKTWLWLDGTDAGYRNEWARYDPGTGPELFDLDGAKATCFICADGEAPRCIDRAAQLRPDVVFYPNNRGQLPEHDVFAKRAKAIRAPMLVTNRVGLSWIYLAEGGCAVYSAGGEVLAAANRKGKEEILIHNLELGLRQDEQGVGT